jgi:hypothetical protein
VIKEWDGDNAVEDAMTETFGDEWNFSADLDELLKSKPTEKEISNLEY